jgi:hypothetical protein
MGSDSAPQPKYDPDFGPGMEYESGERNNKADEAEKIREEWKKSEKEKNIIRHERKIRKGWDSNSSVVNNNEHAGEASVPSFLAQH